MLRRIFQETRSEFFKASSDFVRQDKRTVGLDRDQDALLVERSSERASTLSSQEREDGQAAPAAAGNRDKREEWSAKEAARHPENLDVSETKTTSKKRASMRTVWGPASMRMDVGRHQIDFAFHNVVKEHESSCGRFATVRYLTRISTARGFRGDFNSSNN